ncbi:hypothetical protein [Ruania rhizosphaerae]|uniref:hypothetical protein n=1 Tax=Ruania rhizosphaerae TaxID=1840413 RepID=UPI001356EC02|nr:hypothetical protein [Ruania rhizosphaerae]
MSQQPPEQGPQDPAQQPNSGQPYGQPQQPGTPPPPPGQPSYGAAVPPPSGYPSPEQGGFQPPAAPGPGPDGQYGAPGPGYGGPPQAPGVNPTGYGSYGQPAPAQFDFGGAFGYAWKTVIRNPVVWILGMVLVAIVVILVGLLNPSALAVFDAANGSFNVATSQSFTAMGFVSAIVSALVMGLVQALAQNAALRETAGNKPSFGDVFQIPNMQNALIWAVVWGAANAILQMVPGVGPLLALVASIFVLFTMSSIIDRGISWVDGIKTSVQLVQQNLGPTLLLVLLFIVLAAASVITCGLGTLIAAPMGAVATAYAYRSFSGQPIAPKA